MIAECTSSTYKYKSYWDISREPTKTQQINAVNDYIDIKEIEDRIQCAELEGQAVKSILNMKGECWPSLDATSPRT